MNSSSDKIYSEQQSKFLALNGIPDCRWYWPVAYPIRCGQLRPRLAVSSQLRTRIKIYQIIKDLIPSRC